MEKKLLPNPMSPSVIFDHYYLQVMNLIKRIEESMSLKKVINIAIIEPSKDDRAILENRLKKAFKSRINLIIVPYLEFYISEDVDLYIIVDREVLRKEHNWKALWKKLEKRKGRILFVSYSPHLNLPKGTSSEKIDLAYATSEILEYIKERTLGSMNSIANISAVKGTEIRITKSTNQ